MPSHFASVGQDINVLVRIEFKKCKHSERDNSGAACKKLLLIHLTSQVGQEKWTRRWSRTTAERLSDIYRTIMKQPRSKLTEVELRITNVREAIYRTRNAPSRNWGQVLGGAEDNCAFGERLGVRHRRYDIRAAVGF